MSEATSTTTTDAGATEKPKRPKPAGHFIGARITDDQYAGVKSTAESQGLKVATFVRQAVLRAAGISLD